MTALGPICVATAVHDIDHWDAEVIDENNYRTGPTDASGRPDHRALQQERPAEAVGLYGGLTSTIPRLLELAAEYKSLGAFTIAGGQHFVPDNVEHALRNGVDVVVLGEGERTIVELLRCLDRGGELSSIPGIAFLNDDRLVITPARPPITDFDELAIPDFGLLSHARMRIYPVSGTRGCAMKCEFCSVRGKPRFASSSRMMAQFASIYEKHGGKLFFVVDDLFGQNRRATIELCHMLRDYQQRVGVRFWITVQIRLDKARDTELLTAMREAGVNVLAIGFESPVAAELQAMDKHLKPDDMLGLVKCYHDHGFRIHGMFIFGYPARAGEEMHVDADTRVRQFRRFIRKARLDTVQVLLPIPLPGTELTDRLRRENRILPTDHVGLEYYDGNFPLIQPDPPMTPEEMQAAAHQIMGHLYRPRAALKLAMHIVSFPGIGLRLHHARKGWQRWTRKWHRDFYRTGGWLTLRQWTAAFRRDSFTQKLARAQQAIRSTESGPVS